jgi:hypothetical protein
MKRDISVAERVSISEKPLNRDAMAARVIRAAWVEDLRQRVNAQRYEIDLMALASCLLRSGDLNSAEIYH